MPNTTPHASLPRARMVELGFDAEALGLRLGYSNPAKAAGRVQAFLDDNMPLSPKSRSAAERLPEALDRNYPGGPGGRGTEPWPR